MYSPILNIVFPIFLVTALASAKAAETKSNPDDRPKASSQTSGRAGPSAPANPMYFESWTFYFDRLERDAATVYFDRGKFEISLLEQLRLQDLLGTRKQQGNLDEVLVASWSDKPYPESSVEKLSKADRELADKRNASIETLLKNSGVSDVETFSMAEKPSWYQKTFATDTAQIKGEARDKGWNDSNEQRISSLLKLKGGASKAVVIFRPLNRNLSTSR